MTDRQTDGLKPYSADRPILIKSRAQVPLDNALVLGNLCEYRHKTRFFGLHFSRRGYRSTFNHFDVIDPKRSEVVEITQNNGHYAVQGR